MAVKNIRIAILAGGSGTRFWPAGRRSMPKQVLALDGDDPQPLITLTVERLSALSTATPWIVAPKGLKKELARHLPHLDSDSFIGEPRARNTAAAVVLAAHVAARKAPDAAVVAVPADHHVHPAGRYRRVLAAMASRAKRSRCIVALGLKPKEGATGYGYLRLGDEVETRAVGSVYEVQRYIEKPVPSRARRLAKDGNHLWNGGTFAFRPDVLLDEAAKHLPEVAAPLTTAFAKWGRRGFTAALEQAYEAMPSISVDYGIMERTDRVEVLASDIEWDDLGNWDAVARHRKPDTEGNAVRGDATLIDVRDCVVDAAEGHVALLGVEDLIVVRTGDTVLVTRRGRGEEVRKIVERLETEGREDLLS